MKRLLALALAALVCMAIAAVPGEAGSTPTKIKFSTWKVVTNEGTAKADPGDTYKHCPSNPVMRLVVIGKMSHPGKKGVKYAVTWKHNGNFVVGQDYKTGKHGKVRAALAGGGAPLENGKWQVYALRQGQPAGKSTLKIASGGPGC
ncbi:MAG: hypothetical protein QOJ14_313 [Thermoleophilaceae bacterium]|nr:hypothetical protein [Thermoleophilaceae bacterium]